MLDLRNRSPTRPSYLSFLSQTTCETRSRGLRKASALVLSLCRKGSRRKIVTIRYRSSMLRLKNPRNFSYKQEQVFATISPLCRYLTLKILLLKNQTRLKRNVDLISNKIWLLCHNSRLKMQNKQISSSYISYSWSGSARFLSLSIS